MSYYRSAEEMAGDLGLGVLLRADLDPRVLNRHDRLSGYAADPAQGARIYNIVKSAMTRDGASGGLARKVLWVTAPYGSLHHLPWVVGLGEHAARDGLIAMLADGDESGPLALLAEGGGRPLPSSVLPTGAVAGSAYASPTDLEGVSIVRRGTVGDPSLPLPLETRPWCLLRADALPEDLDGAYPDAQGTDGVILVAPFRDHSRDELTAIVRGLRKAGQRVLGLVALGPRAEVSAGAPPQGSAGPRSHQGTAEGAGMGGSDSGSSDAGSGATTAASAPATTDDRPRAVPLIASWDGRARGRSSRRPVALILIALAVAVTVTAILLLKDRFAGVSVPSRDSRDSSEAILEREPASVATSPISTEDEAVDPVTSDSTDAVEPPYHAPFGSDADPRMLHLVPLANQIAGEDELGSSDHDDGHWSFLDDAEPQEAPEDEAIAPGFGVAIRTDGAATGADSTASSTDGARNPADSVAIGSASAMIRPDGPAASAESGEGSESLKRPEIGFLVHLSSFRLREEADREVSNLSGRGIDAYHVRVVIPGRGLRPWYRVVTGLSDTFAEAESLAMILISDGKIPYAHIVGQGGHGDPAPVGTLN